MLFAVTLPAALLLLPAGCGPTSGSGAGGTSSKGAAEGAAVAPGETVSIGFIYVGPKDDYGYNQAAAEGAGAVKAMPGVKVVEQELVPETDKVQKTMETMIEDDGVKLIFPTSFGYFNPYVLNVAKEYPNVTLLHCGGLYDATKHPKNVGSYFGYIDECEYLSGIVAGHATKSKKLGFVAAKPIPQVLRNINAFLLGARTADPSITCKVIFTGDWSIPVKETEATNSLIDQGVDVITCHVDSPKAVVETAEKRGIMTCGYHASQATLAPKGYLTGAGWKWGKVCVDYVNMVKTGKEIPHLVRGGLKEGIVKMSPYGPAATPEGKKAADEAKAKLMKGDFVIFMGPLKDNTGKEIVAAGKGFGQRDVELEKMNYLLDGVEGKVGQ